MFKIKTFDLYKKVQTLKVSTCKRYKTHFMNGFNIKKNDNSNEIVKWMLLGIPITSFGLGCWQVNRLQWKLGLIDMVHAKTNNPPVDMPEDHEKLEEMEYVPVKVRGEFLHEKELLIGPRALIEPNFLRGSGSLVADTTKNQGWLVVTPFRLENGETIIVNRGWIPSQLRPQSERANSMVKGKVELTGLVRLSEKRPPFMPKNQPARGSWFYRDLEQLSNYLGCSPVWIDAKGVQDPPDGWPIPNQTRLMIRNEHLSYIVTWFSLSAVTGLMWQHRFMRRLF